MRTLLIPICLVFLALGCSRQLPENSTNIGNQADLTSREGAEAPVIRIVDAQRTTIANAKVLIGYAENNPFAGNFLVTNEKGEVPVPAEWNRPLPVTIQAKGYTRATFFAQLPENQEFRLSEREFIDPIEISGVASEFTPFIKEKDGYVEFALVFPMLGREQMFLFDASQVLSPQMDVIDIYGQKISIPSNTSIPKQKEKYSVFSFEIDKPTYRSFVRKPGVYQMYAGRGRALVTALKNAKNQSDTINALDVLGGGSKSVVSSGTKQVGEDIPVNQLNFTGKQNVTAPAMPENHVLLTVSMAPNRDHMLVSDIKVLKSKETKAMAISGKANQQYLFMQSQDPNFSIKGGSLTISSQPQPAKMLAIPAPPQVAGRSVIMNPPPVLGKLLPTGTLLRISRVEKFKNGDYQTEIPTLKWELFAPGWVSKLDVPVWPEPDGLGEVFTRWESVFVAQEQRTFVNGPLLTHFQNATHVTKNSLDLQ